MNWKPMIEDSYSSLIKAYIGQDSRMKRKGFYVILFKSSTNLTKYKGNWGKGLNI